MSIITLTTDFGLADGYVGTMKGVILGIAPSVTIVDISHNIPPQDVREAAYVLYTAYPYFPPGTIHVVVVDPGVGSERRAIALRTPRATFVAPDNGVLSYVIACETVEEIVNLTNPRYHLLPVSRTFHGRDVFAPAAAYLAQGIPLTEMGEPVAEIITFALPQPQVRPGGTIVGQIIHIDRFGNLITSIKANDLPYQALLGERVIEVKGKAILGIANSYAEVPPGELLAIIGSANHLEIAVSGGSAAQALDAKVGDEVVLRVRGHEDS